MCYDDGAVSRNPALSMCLTCSADASQSSFTQASGYCLIDKVCHANMEAGLECQYCDIAKATNACTLRDGWALYPYGSCNLINQTWTTQTATLPEFEWVVLDHGIGDSYGFFAAVAEDGIFVSGVSGANVTLTNSQTGVSLGSKEQGTDSDLFITKLAFDGTPLSIWTYSTTIFGFPIDMVYSNGYLAVAGYFSGEIIFGTTILTTQSAEQSLGFVVKFSAVDGAVL